MVGMGGGGGRAGAPPCPLFPYGPDIQKRISLQIQKTHGRFSLQIPTASSPICIAEDGVD